MKKSAFFPVFLAAALVLVTACGPLAALPLGDEEPYKVSGSFDYGSVDYVLEDRWIEHAVALVDLYGFVIRDQEWEIPVSSQYLGYMSQDLERNMAAFELWLPQRPDATLVDVDNNGRADTGVQVFTVAWWANTYGGVYAEGDDRATGWPAFLASVKTDEESDYEIVGGRLIVWSPDDKQSFPTGYGDDGRLFTDDDPTARIQAGWTIVDLDESPFAFIKQVEVELTLYQPLYVGEKDFTALSYTEAFEQLFAFVSQGYAFNGIPGKQPDFEALYAVVRPQVAQAQAGGDAQAFYFALRDFTYGFDDSHVGMSPSDAWNNAFLAATAGGFGFAIRELDDGRVIASYLTENGPAAQAGMQAGAQVTAFDEAPIAEAIAQVVPWTLPASTEWYTRYQQARYLLRAAPGSQASVTFTNPGGVERTVTLTAVAERDSFARTSLYYGVDTATFLLPVDFEILDSGVGYIGVRSNEDDVSLLIKLFERALKTFQEAGVPGIIIDMRFNGGGLPLGLAGFLTGEEIPLGQTEYFNGSTGRFEPEGLPDKVTPSVNQYHFDRIALLVGPNCASACEQEAYGFSQVPGALVVGMFPTAGAFAEVSRGRILMPDGIYMQFPMGRFVKPDGSLFLEGVGVQPTLRVPIDEETVLTEEDVVLRYGEQAVLEPAGLGITPSAPPRISSLAETQAALGSARQFEELARQRYTEEDYLKVPNELTFTVELSRSETLLWVWTWCAADQATLADNLAKMELAFTLNGQDVPAADFLQLDYDSGGQKCRAYLAALTDWRAGEHHAVTRLTFVAPLNDGLYDFPIGTQAFDYGVFVRP